ncbi:hypothetical protein FRB94_000666 [Tulasnella sp. JGI-2019a]|nr:hypothetical protein FRB94_000666 [Tulasnella sp. JGI-2019a]
MIKGRRASSDSPNGRGQRKMGKNGQTIRQRTAIWASAFLFYFIFSPHAIATRTDCVPMPVITTLTDLQRGTLWGEYVEAFLIRIYTCLLVVTPWRPIQSKRPLTFVGWTIVAIYCLTLCRVVVCFWTLYRALFANGGDHFKLESTDYILRGLQDGLGFMAVLASGGLFCWRLYVICFIVVIDFLLAAWPHDQRYISLHVSFYIWVSAVTLAHTAYITICITGRLWRVGNATNKLYRKRRNRYQGAINAIAQNGVIYVVSMVLSIITGAISVMVVVVGRINPSMNGISATLLVLEPNMYQDRTQREEDSNPPAITGASIHFAIPQGSFSSISEG